MGSDEAGGILFMNDKLSRHMREVVIGKAGVGVRQQAAGVPKTSNTPSTTARRLTLAHRQHHEGRRGR